MTDDTQGAAGAREEGCEHALERLDAAAAEAMRGVLAVAEEWGFGATMQFLADTWAERDPIGALTVGPCRSPAPSDRVASVAGPKIARAAVSPPEPRDVRCINCGQWCRLDEHFCSHAAMRAHAESILATIRANIGPDVAPAVSPVGGADARRVDTLRHSLAWALDYIADGAGEDETPSHDCEFDTCPEKGACDFHSAYWTARSALATPPSGDKT